MKKKSGFLDSIEIQVNGSQQLCVTYKPIVMWICSSLLIFVFGAGCLFAIVKVPDFRLFASVSCVSFTFFGIDLLRHLGSTIELDFNKAEDSLLYRKTLLTSHLEKRLRISELVRVEAIAKQSMSAKVCLLFRTVKPIYIELFFDKSQYNIADEINDFLYSSQK